MTTTSKNRPVEVIRDGAIKASIWKNENEKGPFFTVTFSRTYRSNGAPKDTDSFSGAQLLKLSRLAILAYEAVGRLKAEAQTGDEDAVDEE